MNQHVSTETLTLYDVLGGETTIQAAIDVIYGRTLSDDKLAFYVRGLDLEETVDFQLELFSMIFIHGMPEDSEAMEQDLTERLGSLFTLGLDARHFYLLQGHAVLALESLGINRLTIVETIRAIGPLRKIFENGAKKAKSRHASARRSLTL